MANFRPAVAGIPGVAVLPLVKKSRASSEMSRKSAGIPGVAVMPLVKKSRASSEMSRKSPPGRKFRHAAYVATTVNDVPRRSGEAQDLFYVASVAE